MKEGWTYKKLGDVGITQTGTTPSKTNSANYGDFIPFIRPAEIPVDGSGKINYNTEIRLSEEGVKNGRLFKTNSVLMVCIGSIGKLGYLEQDASCNQQINVLTPNAEYDSKYIFYAMSTPAFQKESLKIAQGAQATLPIINKSKWSNLLIPIPPTIDEQHFIVSRLDAAFANIDTLKANAEKQLTEARQLFQAELAECMRPKEGWEEKKMTDLYDVRDGTHDSPKYHETGYPLVTSKNLRGGVLDMSNVSLISEEDYRAINNRSKVNIGDVLFAMIGTIGNPVYVQVEPNYAIKNMALFKVPSNQSGEFLRYYLLNENVLLKMQTESNGTTQKFVSLGYLRNFLMTIPSLTEQKEIVARLDALSAHVRSLEEVQRKTLAECDALKQAMLRDVFE